MTGYVRQDVTNEIDNGKVIDASTFDAEYDAIEAAFNNTTGHTHDGSSAEGAPIAVVGPTQDFVATGTDFAPKTDNTYDLGSAANGWRDLYVERNADVGGTLDVAGNTTVGGTVNIEGNNLTLNSDGGAGAPTVHIKSGAGTTNSYILMGDSGSIADDFVLRHYTGPTDSQEVLFSVKGVVLFSMASTPSVRTRVPAQFDSSINVGGIAVFNGATTFNDPLVVASGNSTTLGGATTVSSTLGVVGAANFSSTLGVTGAAVMQNNLTVLGTTRLNDNLTMAQGVDRLIGFADGGGNIFHGLRSLSQSINLESPASVNIRADVDNTSTTGVINFWQGADLAGVFGADGRLTTYFGLTVAGGAIFNNGVNCAQTFDVVGAATVQNSSLGSTKSIVNREAGDGRYVMKTGAQSMAGPLTITGVANDETSVVLGNETRLNWSTAPTGGDYISWKTGVGLIGYENGLEAFRLESSGTAAPLETTVMTRRKGDARYVMQTGAQSMTGPLTVTGALTANGSFIASGNASVGGLLTASGSLNVVGAATVQTSTLTTAKTVVNREAGDGRYIQKTDTAVPPSVMDAIKDELVDFFVPVGTVLVTENNVNPGTRFAGTTWVADAAGRAIVGVGNNGETTWTAGQTKGSETHTLTDAQMPIHNHAGTTLGDNQDHAHFFSQNTGTASVNHTHRVFDQTGGEGGSSAGGTNNQRFGVVSISANTGGFKDTDPAGADHIHAVSGFTNGRSTQHDHSFSTDSRGSGQAHNNVQPSIARYVWRRTA